MGLHPCPDCGRRFGSKNAVGVHRQAAHDVPWQDESKLREMYVDRRLQTTQIAGRWGTTQNTIDQWLRRFEIERRDPQTEQLRGMRRKAAHFRTRKDGYERWSDHSNGENAKVYVHRLLAVAEFGFGETTGGDVHHRNGVPWDNRPDNIELIDKESHGRMHAEERWGVGQHCKTVYPQ